VRPRGEEFQRGNETEKHETGVGVGGDPDHSVRQATGRAYRDPFDPVLRSEIVPSEPAGGRAETLPARPKAATPEPVERQSLLETPEWSPGDGGKQRAERDAKSSAKDGKGAEEAAKTARDETKKATDGAKAAGEEDAAKKAAREAADRADAAGLEAAKSAKDGAADATEGEKAAKEGDAAKKAAREAADRADAAGLEAAIKQAIAEAVPGSVPHVDVKVVGDGVLISLTDDYEFGMFAIASAEPRPAMVVVMDKMARILAARSEPLIIRGHTDRRPYRTAAYDNWRLSAARAHMAYVMLTRGGIEEKRFERIEGYADRSLRVPDDPEAAQNRRIEILLRKQPS
jgi:chemotaxis protein MotB